MTCTARAWPLRIKDFQNPVTQAPGGGSYDADRQRWKLGGREVTALAIAAQSPVDCADVYLSGAQGGIGRIRISVDRPWFGRLDPAEYDSIIFVPVRPIDTLSALSTTSSIDEIHSLQVPDLIVEIYTDGCPPPIPSSRAVNVDTATGDLVSTTLALSLCIPGRDKVLGFRWTANTFAGGCTTVNAAATLTAYGMTAAGVLTPITSTRAGAGIASGQFGELWWAPSAPSVATVHDGSNQWCYMRLVLTPDAGTFSGRIIGEAR